MGMTRVRGGYARKLYSRYTKAEVKNLDIYADGIVFGVTMAVGTTSTTGNLLVGVLQGTSENQRIGRDILVKSVHIRGVLEFIPSVVADTFDMAIIYVIFDTQCNGGGGGGTPCVLADLFVNTAAGEELLNMDNTGRFRVLRRLVYSFNTPTFTPAGLPVSQFAEVDCWIPCNTKVTYSAGTGTISEIRTNNIFLAYGSSAGKCVFAGVHRIRFTDV